MIVGGYSMELYCDSGKEQPRGTVGHAGSVQSPDGGYITGALPGEFHGESRTECERAAKRAGWRLGKTEEGVGICVCPTCVGEGVTLADVRARLEQENAAEDTA